MSLLKSVAHRERRPEIMDQPDLESGRLYGALRGLERVNSWSGSAGILWPAIRTLAHHAGGRVLRVLDIATGAGDVPARLSRKAQRAGLPVTFEACDCNAASLQYAREQAQRKGAAVHFFEWDALQGELPAGYDVIMSSLFLHHLDQDQAVSFLQRMARAAGQLVLINDLVRSRSGFLLAYLGVRLLTTSSVVHVDGPRSVEGAFTIEEVRDLASRAGLAGAQVVRRWPCRYLLAWSRPREV